MSWLGRFQWTEGFKNTACRYLLQRYLGQFLEEKLTLDQLTVNLCNGTGSVTNVKLDVKALNEMAQQHQLPLQFIDGSVAEMSISIPWLSLLTEASYVEIKGLKLTVQPREREETGTSMFESMLSSMNSSMQLAQECLQEDAKDAGNSQPLESVELFAQTIDSFLCKIKVRFVDTVIRLEHVPMGSMAGVALELRIKILEYSDEAGLNSTNMNLDSNKSKGCMAPVFMTKRFYMEGVTIYTDEFPSKARTSSKSRCSTPDSRNSDAQYSSPQMSPNQSMDKGEENYLNNSLTTATSPILFAKLFGRQELVLKAKHEESTGPNVELELAIGTFTSFLSPRQMHVLLELAHGLASPDLEDLSNVAPRNCKEKPMANSDFHRVERELLQKFQPVQGVRSMGLKHTQGWSTSTTVDSDNEDEFLPIRTPGATSMSDSLTSNISMDGSITASNISSKSAVSNVPKQHKYRPNTDTDSLTESSQFYLRISSIAIVLLHEDILTLCTEGVGLTNASTKQMETTAENFFMKLEVLTSGGLENKDFDKASKLLLEACQLNHIRVLASPLIADAKEKTTAQFSVISGNLNLGSLEVVECLVDSGANSQRTPMADYIELLTFTKEASVPGYTSPSDIRMKFKYTEKAVRRAQITKFAHPRTEIDIQMEPCRSEIDVTIVDRISAVLNRQPICNYSLNLSARDAMNHQSLFYQAAESPTLSESRMDIKISSPKCVLKLRFPIPDMRPLHDMNRVPWWKRSVRPDYVTFKLIDTKIHSSMESQCHHLIRHEIQCRRLLLAYTEVDSDIPVEIGKATADEKSDGCFQQDNEGFGWPRFVITLYPQHFGGPLEDSSEGEPDSSLDDTLENLENTTKHEPSPFSSKRIIHESDTPHSKSETPRENNDQEESDVLIIPGNRQEILEFIEEGTRGSKIQLEIGLPCTSIQIPSKHLYELLYNRFNTDLFLWEPSAPRPTYANAESHMGLDFSSNLLQESIYPRFSMCKSGIQYDSDSDSFDDEGFFYSTQDRANKAKTTRVSKSGQSKLTVTLNINHGLLSMYTPVRDSLGNVIPGQQGELILRLGDATLFSVTAYKGDVNLGYTCAIVKDVSLNHCGLTTTLSQSPPLRSINSITPRHCQPSIYRTEPGANISFKSSETDMLTLAIRIHAENQTHKAKTFTIAVGIRNATLRHRMCTPQTSWFTQLTDCFDVSDHPIAGYSPLRVLTEFHVHIWDCAIDYRPIHLPLRSITTLGSFSISSNVSAEINTSTLRFIAEDLALFVSDKLGKNINLRRDYVCVMDLGLFELSLKFNEKMYDGAPRIDLRASNDCLQVRTCADSARALMELLTYFASDGDLAQNVDNSDTISVPGSRNEEILVGDEGYNLSKSQVEWFNNQMEDAMEDTVKETVVNSSKRTPEVEKQVEEFYFPDESNPFLQPEFFPQASRTLANEESTLEEEEDPDEDFCILGEEAGVGILPIHGLPEIRWLCNEPIHIIENHFPLPQGKTDLLKTPKSFPSPVLKYKLCEMNLNWQWYGGKDFEGSQSSTKKYVTIDEAGQRFNAMNQGRSRSVIGGVGYSKSSPNEIRFGSVPNSPRARTRESPSDWYRLGGPGRNTKLLMELQFHKIRFLHEVYPEDLTQASRQVLLINEIEITDRLASSSINKFLYQYISGDTPRQSQANMFELKAIHIRPDPKLNAQEVCLRISALPLQLNIDQDSLHFLVDFFSELSEGSKQNLDNSNASNNVQSCPGSKQGTPTHHPPVMSVNDSDSSSRTMNSSQESDMMDQNLLILLEDELRIKESKKKTKTVSETQDDSQPLYFRSVVFSPALNVKVDYEGKHVDFSRGPLVGILLGLTHLNKSELRLKELSYRHGLLGLDKLITYLLQEWIQDIKDNQLRGLLVGVGPMHSLIQLFQGIRDLFWMPIEQYQKDGRIVRGLQRGANSFTTSTAMAALELTSRLVRAIQSTAETAYDMVSPGPSVRQKSRGQKGRRKRYSQPSDIREGMTNAYMLVKEGLGETANQLVRVASEEHEHKGVSGAVGGVLRQIPPTVVKPIILATEATSNVLGGIQYQLVPDARREAVQKWRQDSADVN